MTTTAAASSWALSGWVRPVKGEVRGGATVVVGLGLVVVVAGTVEVVGGAAATL
ncbi:MAG TPA: hypothetical protein VGL49_02645 [Acidimicrobiales bacterium]